MKTVASLRYGVIFKKAFSVPEIFTAFVEDVIGAKMEIDQVETEKSFDPPIGNIEQGQAIALRLTIEQILQQRFTDLPTIVSEQLQLCSFDELNALVLLALNTPTWVAFEEALPNEPNESIN